MLTPSVNQYQLASPKFIGNGKIGKHVAPAHSNPKEQTIAPHYNEWKTDGMQFDRRLLGTSCLRWESLLQKYIHTHTHLSIDVQEQKIHLYSLYVYAFIHMLVKLYTKTAVNNTKFGWLLVDRLIVRECIALLDLSSSISDEPLLPVSFIHYYKLSKVKWHFFVIAYKSNYVDGMMYQHKLSLYATIYTLCFVV